jgi:hypothetical protein
MTTHPTFIGLAEHSGRRFFNFPEEPTRAPEMPAGVYTLLSIGDPAVPYFMPMTVDNDTPVDCHQFSRDILAELESFFAAKGTYDAFGFPHKRGYLLHGGPGCGKSTSLRLMAQRFAERYDGVVFWTKPGVNLPFWLDAFRRHYPTRPVLHVVEDIDTNISNFESGLLEFLDGAQALRNYVLVATTNYIDRIPDRIKNRPSRIDRLIEVKFPDVAARAAYLARFPLTPARAQAIAAATEGFSMAHLKEVLIATECLGASLEATVARLRGLPVPASSDADEEFADGDALDELDRDRLARVDALYGSGTQDEPPATGTGLMWLGGWGKR